jgi:predicted alpha/beta-fold hydrolase
LEKISANPNVALVMTKYGGHISFVEGLCPTGCNFACRLLSDYLQNILVEIKTQNENPNQSTPPFHKPIFTLN